RHAVGARGQARGGQGLPPRRHGGGRLAPLGAAHVVAPVRALGRPRRRAGAPQGRTTGPLGEGRGAVVEGSWSPEGYFRATHIMAKHSEEYKAPHDTNEASIKELMRTLSGGSR